MEEAALGKTCHVLRWILLKTSVYNCRTSNAWDLDLALSATHYPERGLTFAVMYGTSNAIERTILKRLGSVKVEAAHPLLLHGILAELELARHNRLVEGSINEMETKIFELNFASSRPHDYCRSEIERRSESKRTAWLDLSYLRNSLVTWNTQLLRMIEHSEALEPEQYIKSLTRSGTYTISSSMSIDVSDKAKVEEQTIQQEQIKEQEDFDEKENYEPTLPLDSPFQDPILPQYLTKESETSEDEYPQRTPCSTEQASQDHIKHMHRTTGKIKARLEAIRDEYDEKIRDCTMRVDGMAMATQWVSISRLSL